MQGVKRKLVYVSGYEILGLFIGAAVMTLLTGESADTTGVLAIMISTVATAWNLAFNYMFEAWESRQSDRTRTLRRRIVHALAFQLTLICFLIPLIAWWLEKSLFEAFLLDLVFIAYIPVYTFVYNWTFDAIFEVPASAVNDV